MSSSLCQNFEIALGDREVHVWKAGLDLATAFTHQRYLVLSEAEKYRAERFRFAKDRAHYVCGRGILRVLLGSYLNAPPENVMFCHGPDGKPELSPAFRHADLHFNLSHSHGQLLVAIARRFNLGVDIERVRPEMEIEAIAERFFSSAEVQQLSSLIGLEKRDAFFNGWTRKEA